MDPLGPLFTPPHDEPRLWILSLCLAIGVIAGCLFVLVRGDLRETIFSSYAALLIPALVYALGDIQLMEASKSVEFCGSCHTMTPVVEALHNDETTLAATHYRRGAVSHSKACYECHSGYGIWGDVDAKAAGLNHMLHTVTGNFDFPLTMRASFDISSCLNCHATAEPFRAVEAHQDEELQDMLLSGEMACTDCHESAHPEEALSGANHVGHGGPFGEAMGDAP